MIKLSLRVVSPFQQLRLASPALADVYVNPEFNGGAYLANFGLVDVF